MKRVLRLTWIILLDIVAVALLLFALLFGWLPGAPGIPIALAGLGLLAINHTWAARLLHRIRDKGRQLLDSIRKK